MLKTNIGPILRKKCVGNERMHAHTHTRHFRLCVGPKRVKLAYRRWGLGGFRKRREISNSLRKKIAFGSKCTILLLTDLTMEYYEIAIKISSSIAVFQ